TGSPSDSRPDAGSTDPTGIAFVGTFIQCPAFDVLPITVGETLTGVLTATDCLAPVLNARYFGSGAVADRYAFSGTAGQQVVVTRSEERRVGKEGRRGAA